jgi:hypothetical protein
MPQHIKAVLRRRRIGRRSVYRKEIFMTTPSAAAASRAIGAMFFAGFGAIWLAIWSQRSLGLQVGVLALIAAGAVALLACAWRQYQRNRSAREAEAETLEKKSAGRIFNIVNITQWVTILIVGNVLANVGLKDWVLASAMFIVGVHFFPLAKAFGNPVLNYTGGALVLLAIGYPFLVPGGAANPVGCLGAGIILWATALVSLNRAQQ